MTDQRTRARSFGAVAAQYHRARTGYDTADLAWALHLPDRPDPPDGRAGSGLRVLDVAAGTGRITLTALQLGAAVGGIDAVEPDPGMRAEFTRRVSPRSPVTLHDGTAEAVPLPDGSVDAVVVGSAYHWFDPQPAAAELARVLRPGGTLAALWTGPDEQLGWVRSYREAARALLEDGEVQRDGTRAADPRNPEPGTAELADADPADADLENPEPVNPNPADPAAGDDRHRDIPASPYFEPTERREFLHIETFQRSELVAAVGTYSALLVADPARRDAALAAVADAVAAVIPDDVVASDGAVRLPVRVRGARCVRR